MGLPLFVAPVESDLPRKASVKSTSSSHSQSGVRRANSTDSRSSRSRRSIRAARINDALSRQSAPFLSSNAETSDSNEPLGAARRAGFRVYGRNDPLLSSTAPWVVNESPAALDSSDTNLNSAGPPFREALRDVTRNDEPRSRPSEDHQHTILDPNWHQSSSHRLWAMMRQRNALRERNAQSREAPRRSQFADPISTRFDRSPDPGQAPHGLHQTGFGAYSGDGFDNGILDAILQVPQPHGYPGDGVHRSGAVRRRSQFRWSTGLDGLGDRDRSVTPEWDTLLSTLTPDPQAPSASSSFASAAATQSAGASSHTTPPALEPCDPGFEVLDRIPDGPDYEHPEWVRLRRRREELGLTQAGYPSVRHPARAESSSSRRETSAPAQSQSNPTRSRTLAERRLRWDDEETAAAAAAAATAATATAATAAAAHGPHGAETTMFGGPSRPRDAWVGMMSVGTSDEEQHQPDRSTRQNDEDWNNVRRILHDLAMRDDIPEDWWAEAGLSRAGSRDASQ